MPASARNCVNLLMFLLELRRDIEARAHIETRLRKLRFQLRHGRFERRIVIMPFRQQDAIAPTHKAAGTQQTTRPQRLLRQDRP